MVVRWRFLALSMPVLVVLLFSAYSGGLHEQGERDVRTLVLLPFSGDRAPGWGEIEDRTSLEIFMRRFFPSEPVPDVDFAEDRVFFLLAGPQGGKYAGFEIQAYREDSGGGITVFCEKRASSATGQLISVPRFKGEAVFFFR